jgi:hypothetical protein
MKELIELISEGYDLANIDAIINKCQEAWEDPQGYASKNDLFWLVDSDPYSVINFVLPLELSDISIFGDKIDEIHEEMRSSREWLSEFPYEKELDSDEYFKWIDNLLAEHNEEIVQIGDTGGDALTLFLINKNNTERIFELASKFNLKYSKMY